jgi:hypothetical protein
MPLYYKATRPDGFSFHGAPPLLYTVGRVTRDPQHHAEAGLCGPGWLHASDAAAETLNGGSWPCRLFEVDGTPSLGFDEDHPHKGGFAELDVVRELDAHLALGPNGAQVAAYIERLKTTTVDDWPVVIRERDAARAAAIAAARDAARAAIRYAAGNAAWNAAWVSAADPAGAAALALVVRDLIPPAQFDVLYAPIAVVIPVSSLDEVPT